MSAPLVSIVIPTHNRSGLLRRSIASVLGQSFQDTEVIVVDDCSTENIAEVVSSFADPRLRYIRRDRQGGPSGARNTGLAAAVGRWVAFQDSDDEWLYNKLQVQLDFCSLHPSVALLSCGMVQCGHGELYVFPPASMTCPVEKLPKVLLYSLVAFTQTWLAKRDVLVSLGGFNEQLRVWDDWDLLMRVCRDYPVRIMAQPFVVAHRTPGSVARDVSRRIWDLDIFIRQYEREPDPNFRARLAYLQSRYLLLQERPTDARACIRESLDLNPSALKSWLVYLFTFMPSKPTAAFLRQRRA